ncbi:MAG: hypothetical protein LIP01_10285 [Tannerellaceae bacterium]|nr:hypothetical protein [Tannerellaceae bacterium]
MKKLLFSLLAVLLITACNEEKLFEETAGEQNTQSIEIDLDYLTETYGPALTRSIAANGGIITVALPIGISEIKILPDGEIPAEGEVKTVIVTGSSFSSIKIRAFDATNSTNLTEVTVTNMGGMGYGNLSIPKYEATPNGSIRIVMFEYFNYNTNIWEMCGYGIQNAAVTTPFLVWTNIENDIPKEGGSYFLNIAGEFPSDNTEYVFFRAVDAAGNPASNTVAIIGNTQKSEIFQIQENTGTCSRTLHIQYRKSTEADFTTFESHVQVAISTIIPDEFTITHNIPTTIPEEGGEYKLYLNGDFTGNQILVWAYDTQTKAQLTNFIPLTNNNRTATIIIPFNPTESIRSIELKFSDDNLASGIIIGIFSQTMDVPGEEYLIPGTNIYLAQRNAHSEGVRGLPTMNWVKTNGISNEYLTKTWIPGTDVIYETGCNAYYEKASASDKGLRRLPTKKEMIAILDAIYETTCNITV